MSKQRLEHRHGDSDEHTAERKPDTLQRVEVITGIGRRRRFSQGTKARIVLEGRAPGAVVSEVARRHGLRPQLFGWRRELRNGMSSADVARAARSAFTPVVVAAEGACAEGRGQREAYARPIGERGLIEITIGEVAIRLHEGVAPRMIAAVLQAVRATS